MPVLANRLLIPTRAPVLRFNASTTTPSVRQLPAGLLHIDFPNEAARNVSTTEVQYPDTQEPPTYISKTNRYCICHVQIRVLL